ncbi:uncharacterized protein LOC129549898 [Moschus berezovskii]|uniref:uncharacterized protein LOC129549898 n=1 Tax=Moschus berezovskii TaxID=68408 RepID=UPI002444DA4C|nr:uncharacterized protein LOC129549898 [Moschus berezovskii]
MFRVRKKTFCVELVQLAQQKERLLPAGLQGEQAQPCSPGTAQSSREQTERDGTHASTESAQSVVRAQGKRAFTGLEASGEWPRFLAVRLYTSKVQKESKGAAWAGVRGWWATPGGGSGWRDSRGGRSPVFGVTTEGCVPGLQGQVARGRPRSALCADSQGFIPACCVRDAVRSAGCGEQRHGEGGGSPGGRQEATAPALGRDLEKLEWGQEGGKKRGKCRVPRAVPGVETQGQRMWLDLLFKEKNVLDVRTTQLAVCVVLLQFIKETACLVQIQIKSVSSKEGFFPLNNKEECSLGYGMPFAWDCFTGKQNSLEPLEVKTS